MIIERAVKILDYFNKEKVVRIILLLLDNLKDASSICHEIMSDINLLGTVIKLQNRHWVDQDITALLDKLFEFLDKNEQSFSSIDKFKREISENRRLRWNPVHTERFWKENFIAFNDQDNLKLVENLVEVLSAKERTDQEKAIACSDLGNFAQYFPMGRQFLETKEIKKIIFHIMDSSKSSSELKKEAITCYQKLLMDTWTNTGLRN